jgi:sugar (pentulose or hexulose) kinase
VPRILALDVGTTGLADLSTRTWDEELLGMADALGRPVTTSGIKEAALRGAAIVVLERLGETPASAPPASGSGGSTRW